MKSSGRCPKCQSREILADVRLIDRGYYDYERDLTAKTYAKPKAILFKGGQGSVLTAWICANCGYTEIYARDPRKLWEARNAAQ